MVSGIGLRKTDFFGSPDPFCTVSLDAHDPVSTKPAKKTLSPVWNQAFVLYVLECNHLSKRKQRQENHCVVAAR